MGEPLPPSLVLEALTHLAALASLPHLPLPQALPQLPESLALLVVIGREEEREEGREGETAPCMEEYLAHLVVWGKEVSHPALVWEEGWVWEGEQRERGVPPVWLYPDHCGLNSVRG